MLSEDKFYEKAGAFTLYPTVDDTYFTLEELKEINYDIQKLNKTRSFILITTYATFHRQNFQSLFKTIDKDCSYHKVPFSSER